MDIIGDIKKHIAELKQIKEALDQIPSEQSELEIFKKYTIERVLVDYEKKLEMMTYKKLTLKCILCEHWVEDTDRVHKDLVICSTCQTNLPKTKTTNEIEPLWGLHVGKIKQDIDNHLLDKFINAGLIWKSGRYWLVHELVMQKHYESKLGYKKKIISNGGSPE